MIFRVGWEWNHSSWAWACTDLALAPYFKAYFRRIVDRMRARLPGCLIDWCSAKEGKTNAGIPNWYPGGDWVDIIGHDRYDWWPPLTSQSAWDSHYNALYKGGPFGPGAWLAYARSEGKPLGVGEWAVANGVSQGYSVLAGMHSMVYATMSLAATS